MRKSLWILCAVCACLIVAPAPLFAQGYDYPSMVGYWSLDEGTGSVAGDPFGHNGTLTFDAGSPHGTNGAGPTWVPGRSGQALSFDGIDDFVEIEPDGAISSELGSVSLWMNTTADQAALAHDSMMFYATRDGGDGFGGDWEMHVNLSDGAGNLNQAEFRSEGAPDVDLFSAAPLNNGQWHHIVATWDVLGGNAVLYVDGAQVASGAWTSNPFVNAGRGDSAFRFGKPWSNGNGGRYYQGLLDEVRLYSRALTQAEVTALFSGTPANPSAKVTRTLPSTQLYKPSVPITVQLEATAVGGGQVVITETVPGGLTPAIVGTPAGTTNIAGSVLTWTVTPGATPETLEYTVTPTAGTSGVLDWVGSVNAGASWTYNVQGDLRMVGNVPIGIFEWHGDVGTEPIGAAAGDPALPGNAVFGTTPAPNATTYWIQSAGSDVWQDGDYCHLLAKSVNGSFVLEAVASWVNPTVQPHGQTKVGVMVRGRADRWGPYMTSMIDSPVATDGTPDGNPGDVMSEGRMGELFGMFSSTQDSGLPAPVVRVRVVRVGSTVASYYFDSTNNWVLHLSQDLPALTDDEALACLFTTSHVRDQLTEGLLDAVSLTQLSLKSALRSFDRPNYVLGTPITVSIELRHAQDANPLVVEETLPPGWTAVNISDGGTQTGNVISWSLNFTGDVTLTYDVLPAGGMARSGVFSGIVKDPFPLDIPIGGETQIDLAGGGGLPIIMFTDMSDNALEDQNMKAAAGSAGITVNLPAPETIPGLGYPIREIDELAPEETATFTTNDGVLILISHTVNSGDIADHRNDPIPIINSEQALNDNDAPPRNEMYMSVDAAARGGVTAVTLINNTHPITEIFALSPPDLQLWEDQGNNPELGVMTGAIGSGVTVLAHNPGLPAEPSLALYEAGTTDAQLQVPAGLSYTAPARRLNLGYHARSFQFPTKDGVILFQRCIQYMAGDPLTVGTPIPAAPSNTQASVTRGADVHVTWADNSDNENGFVISRLTSGTTTFIDIGQVRDGVTSFDDRTAQQGETYTYGVRAFNPTGESASDESQTVTIPILLRARSWRLYR